MILSKYIPTEVIMKIVAYALDYDLSWEGDLTKPSWSTVEGMSSACKRYRAVVLEAWFRIFKAKSFDDWRSTEPEWAQIYRWARLVHLHLCLFILVS